MISSKEKALVLIEKTVSELFSPKTDKLLRKYLIYKIQKEISLSYNSAQNIVDEWINFSEDEKK